MPGVSGARPRHIDEKNEKEPLSVADTRAVGELPTAGGVPGGNAQVSV